MRILILISVLFVPNFLFAQARTEAEVQLAEEWAAQLTARIRDLRERHTITVRGFETPGVIPRGELLHLFFAGLSAKTPADHVAAAQYLFDRFGAVGRDTEVLRQAIRDADVMTATATAAATATSPATATAHIDICARVMSDSFPDAASIAEYVTQIDEQGHRRNETHYQAIIDELTPAVRSNVLQSFDEVSARAINVTLDHEGMAADDAVLYETMMKGLCRGKANASSFGEPQPQ